MDISLTRFCAGAMLAVILFTLGCTRTDSEVLYCDLDDQRSSRSWREGAMHIDLKRRLVYGGDTSSAIYPFVVNDLAGFEAEFPLLLLGDSVDLAEVQGDIAVHDIVFRISPVEGSLGDLWIITAKPKYIESEQAWRQSSTILYSIVDGVLLIGLSASVGDEVFPINYVPCGDRTLRYDDIWSIFDANG